MAITVTEILGTDSISASRLVINDNFNVLKDEINAIETYIDPDAGTIDGLYDLQTAALKVGPTGAPFLEITASVFEINTNLTLSGSINIDGFLAIDKSYAINVNTVLTSIDFDTYVISQTGVTSVTVTLGTPSNGQEITLICAQHGTGDVIIKAQAGVEYNFGFDTAGSADEIILNDVGSTVKLKYIEETTGIYVLYIVGGYNYSVQ
jgi:hypothetical protein